MGALGSARKRVEVDVPGRLVRTVGGISGRSIEGKGEWQMRSGMAVEHLLSPSYYRTRYVKGEGGGRWEDHHTGVSVGSCFGSSSSAWYRK